MHLDITAIVSYHEMYAYKIDDEQADDNQPKSNQDCYVVLNPERHCVFASLKWFLACKIMLVVIFCFIK